MFTFSLPRMACLVALSCLSYGAAAPLMAQTPADAGAVYAALGGRQGLHEIIDDFTQAILADDRINAGFKDADLDSVRHRLSQLFCELAGGPCKYTGKSMQVLHEDLNVTNAQFNALTEDLQIVLEQHHVPFGAQNKLLAKLAPLQKMIVTK